MTDKNNKLAFDATIKTSDAKKNLHVPIVRKKANTKIDNNKISDLGSLSNLSSQVLVKDLMIDMTYQRFPNENKVNAIVKNFNFDAIGVLICSAREDGTIAVIDGGHRVAALRMLGYEDKNVDCLVYFGLSIPEEAQIFNLMNDNRTKPKTQDIFKSRVAANDNDASVINDILNSHGLEVSNRPCNNGFRAIGTITKLYKKYGEVNINTTIEILKNAFGSHSSSFTDVAITAISTVLASYNNIDIPRLTVAVKNQINCANWSNNGAVISKQVSGNDRYVGMAIVVINEYNKKLKKNRLDGKILW